MSSCVKFGVFADLHVDIMHDAPQRLAQFLEACSSQSVDFIIQLGDFCNPIQHEGVERARKEQVLQMFNQYTAPAYHVLGNHEHDRCSKSEVMAFWGMKEPYYSFDCKGWHMVVLDPSYYWEGDTCLAYDHGNYIREHEYEPCLPSHELAWLAHDLSQTTLPTVIFSHQALNPEKYGIVNHQDFQEIVAHAAAPVHLCINGHNHIDRLIQLEQTFYFNLNSISNQWLGEDYRTVRYGKEIDAAYPQLGATAPYRDPVYAIVTLQQDSIDICGVESSFVGDSPYTLRHPFQTYLHELTPRVGSYYIPL